MRNRDWLLAVATVLLLFFCAYSGVLSKPGLKPVWTTDLLQNPAFEARVEEQGKPPVRHWATPELAFVGSRTLAVSFTDDAQTLMNSVNQLRHFHFRTIFLNAEDGRSENQELSWPTIDNDSDLLPMHDGGFVVVAGERLYRYSADFRLTTQASVPPDPGNDSGGEFGTDSTIYVSQLQRWQAQEDPAESSLILRHSNYSNRTMAYFWLDGGSLKVTRSLNLADDREWSFFFSATSDALLADKGSETFISYSDKGWQSFCPEYKNSVASFANKNKFFIVYSDGNKTSYSLITDSCTQLLNSPGVANGTVVARAASGNRVAISENSMQNGFSGVAWTINLRVWNLDPAQEILNLPLTPPVGKGRIVRGPAFAAALSPDGKLLAVLLGSTLMLYNI